MQSVKKRRTLSMAGLSPEQRAIINSQDPPLPGEGGIALVDEPKPEEKPAAKGKPKGPKSKPQKRAPRQKPEPVVDEEAPLLTQTFRISENVVEALLRASMKRKLKKQKPFTQQDIVAQALTGWLSKEGYL